MPTHLQELMLQSLQLLGLGMGAVFIILGLLIALITIVSRLVPKESPVTKAAVAKGIDPNHIAAITAAIYQHRKNRK